METNVNNTTKPQHDAKLPVMRGAFCWAVTGTFHGSIIEAETEWPYRDWETDRKSTRLNSSHRSLSRMPSSA